MRTLMVGCWFVAVTVAPARADGGADPVEIELAALASEAVKVLAKEGQQQIRIGEFTPNVEIPSNFGKIPSNFGPGVQLILRAEFAKRKIAVDPAALIEIKGNYIPDDKDPEVPASKEMFMRLNAELVNTKSRLRLVELSPRAAFGTESLGRAMAVSASFSPDAQRDVRNDQLKRRIQKPETHVAVTKVASSADSPFAVEILVVTDPKAADPAVGRAVTEKDGLAFVAVQDREYYRVKVHNTARFDAAVRVSIDGLDQYAFSDPEFRAKDGRPKFQYLTVPKGKTAVISGWFRNLKQADAFAITEYAKSAAAELNISQAEVGQICVQFYAAWETDAEKPTDETGKNAATGRGEKVDTNLKLVTRTIGALRDQVAIRYAKVAK